MELLFDLVEHIRSAKNAHMRARQVILRPLLTLPGKRPRGACLLPRPPRFDDDLPCL